MSEQSTSFGPGGGYQGGDPKAQAKAEKAYRKAQRPFYKKKRFILLIAIVAIIAIIVISTSGSKGTVSGPSASDPSGASSAASAGSSSAPASKASNAPAYGQTFTWKDGNAVTVSAPEPYTPTSSIVAQMAPTAKAFEVVTVTVKNGSNQPLNPMEANFQGTSGGQQATEIFDSPVISPPTADIQPGATLTWKAAFGVATPGDLAVQAQIGFSESPVVFK